MFPDKSILTESSYVAEELLQTANLSELDRKCLVIIQTVQDGDFSISEALELYGVSKTDFDHFLAKSMVEQLQSFFSQDQSQKFRTLSLLEIFQEMYKTFFSSIDSNSDEVIHHIENLSQHIYDDKGI